MTPITAKTVLIWSVRLGSGSICGTTVAGETWATGLSGGDGNGTGGLGRLAWSGPGGLVGSSRETSITLYVDEAKSPADRQIRFGNTPPKPHGSIHKANPPGTRCCSFCVRLQFHRQ